MIDSRCNINAVNHGLIVLHQRTEVTPSEYEHSNIIVSCHYRVGEVFNNSGIHVITIATILSMSHSARKSYCNTTGLSRVNGVCRSSAKTIN